MLFRITTLILIFSSGWFLNDKYQMGATFNILGRKLTYNDISQALWLISVGLIVAVIAKEAEPFFSKLNKKLGKVESAGFKLAGRLPLVGKKSA
jgi:hypothetical protein